MELPGGCDDQILVLRRSSDRFGLGTRDRTVGLVHTEFRILSQKDCCDHANAATHAGRAMHQDVTDSTPTCDERKTKL